MITDRENMFSVNQAVTTGATAGTDVIDLSVNNDLSRGGPIRATAQVRTAFTSGGSGTLRTKLVESAAADLSNPTTLWEAPAAVAVASLVAGHKLMDVVLPRTSKRYLGVIYTVATADMTAGNIDAGLVLNTETPIADRPSNFNTGF